MQANVKSEPSGGRAREFSPVSMLSEWVRQGVDGYVATQRILLDLVMRQNATTLNALRERLTVPRTTSTANLAELAGEGMSNFIDAQRIFLNLALEQNGIMMNGLQERIGSARSAPLVNILRRSFETLIDMQQHFLTIADKQAQAWVESAKAGKGDAGASLAELTREGMEQFVRSHKKFLDLIAEEASNVAEPARRKEGKEKAADVADLARKSAESLIEMQKKLLDVAGRQVDVNLKAARRAIDFAPAPQLDLTGLTREYVDNFVAAQKAWLDAMMKPQPAAPAPKAARRPARRTRPRRPTAEETKAATSAV